MTLAATLAMLGGGAVAQDGPVSGAPQDGAPLWLISCSNLLDPDELLCEFSQSIVLTQGGQSNRLASAAFTRVAGQSGTNALFSLPFEVSLADPVRVSVDDKEVGTLAWQSCDAGGCHASGPVDDGWLRAMRAGSQLSAALKARDGRDLSFGFQLKDFSRTEKLLP